MEKYIYIFIEAIICLLLAALILLYYVRKGTNLVVKYIAMFAWFLNFFMVVLLPYDICLTNKVKTNEILTNDDQTTIIIIKISYNIIYWVIFICNWIIFPFLKKYEDSGEFTKMDKIKYSIKRNLIRYIILLLILIALFTWAYTKLEEEQFSFFTKNIFNFNYIYRLSLVLILLSYSLIKFPINVYETINHNYTIQYYEYMAKNIDEKLSLVKGDLKENGNILLATIEHSEIVQEMTDDGLYSDEKKFKKIEKQNKLLISYEDHLKEQFDYLFRNSKILGIDLKKNSLATNQEPIKDKKKLVKLNKNIINGILDDLRLQCQMQSIYYNWCFLKTILIQGKSHNYIKIDSNDISQGKEEKILYENNKHEILEESFIPLNGVSFIKTLYYLKIRKYLFFILTIILFLSAGIVIISEISISLPINLSVFSFLISSVTNVFILHLILFFPIIYLLILSMYTFFQLKISGFYGMYGNRQTDAVSLIFFTRNISRIIIPLCLNVILMVNHGDNINKTILENNFKINVQNTIFNMFNKFSPIILILFLLVHGFNIFNKLAKCFGLDNFYIHSEKRDNDIEEGFEILMGLNKKYMGQPFTVPSLEDDNKNIKSSINIDFNRD